MLLKIGNGWVLLRHLQKYWVVGIGYGKDFGRPILNLKVTNLGQNWDIEANVMCYDTEVTYIT